MGPVALKLMNFYFEHGNAFFLNGDEQWWLYLKCNYIGTLKWPAMGICYVRGPEVLGERNNLY
jgi:hypothetical protein